MILDVFLYIFAGFFILNAFILSFSASRTKSPRLHLASIVYVVFGWASIFFVAWWPLLIGFCVAHLVRYIFGDPSCSK